MAEITSFNISKAGLYSDFMDIKLTELQMGGWWKGQLRYHMESLNPNFTYNDLELIDTNFSVRTHTCTYPDYQSDTEFHVQHFLELLGFDSDGMSSICSASSQSGLDGLFFRFRQSNFAYDLDAFSGLTSMAITYLGKVSKIVETNNVFAYDETSTNRDALSIRDFATATNVIFDQSGTSWRTHSSSNYPDVRDKMYLDDLGINITYALYDSDDNDITSEYDDFILKFVRALVLTQPNITIEESSVKTGEYYVALSGSENGYQVTTETTYSIDRSYEMVDSDRQNVATLDYEEYLLSTDLCVDSGTRCYRLQFADDYWDFRNKFKVYPYHSDNPIIAKPSSNYHFIKDGYNAATLDELVYIFSQYSMIYATSNSGDSFLGIGGYVGSLFNDALSGITSTIGMFSELLVKWPISKAIIEFYVWVFTGERNKSDEELTDITSLILTIVISVAISLPSPQGGYAWLTYATASTTVVSGYYQFRAIEIQYDIQDIFPDTDEDDEEDEDDNSIDDYNMEFSDSYTFFNTINQVFNPLDLLYKEQGYNVFDRGMEFDPTSTIEI